MNDKSTLRPFGPNFLIADEVKFREQASGYSADYYFRQLGGLEYRALDKEYRKPAYKAQARQQLEKLMAQLGLILK